MNTPRRTKTEAAYRIFRQQLGDDINLLQSFDFKKETLIREFKYWVIIKNRFPYDKIARTNDMLVSKRPLQSHYDGSKEEQAEYHMIVQLLAEEDFYDALIENFPKVKSVKKYAHTHLVQWNNTSNQEGS